MQWHEKELDTQFNPNVYFGHPILKSWLKGGGGGGGGVEFPLLHVQGIYLGLKLLSMEKQFVDMSHSW